MKVLPWLAVLLAGWLSLPASPALGGSTSDPSARVAEILRDLPGADSVLVERSWMSPRSTAPSRDKDRKASPPGEPARKSAPKGGDPVVVGRPGAEWSARFAKALAGGRLDNERPCVSSWTPNDTTSRLGFRVKAHHHGLVRHFQIRFEERCAMISDKPFGASLDISSVAQPLLELAREALPQDSLLKSMALPPHIPLQIEPGPPEPTRAVTSSSTDELPKFGDHVFVEELPEAVERRLPVRPQEARAAGVSGTVNLQVLVGKDGLVKEIRVIRSIPMLDAAAIECARGWKFKPALAGGKPVAVWVGIPLRFTED